MKKKKIEERNYRAKIITALLLHRVAIKRNSFQLNYSSANTAKYRVIGVLSYALCGRLLNDETR